MLCYCLARGISIWYMYMQINQILYLSLSLSLSRCVSMGCYSLYAGLANGQLAIYHEYLITVGSYSHSYTYIHTYTHANSTACSYM